MRVGRQARLVAEHVQGAAAVPPLRQPLQPALEGGCQLAVRRMAIGDEPVVGHAPILSALGAPGPSNGDSHRFTGVAPASVDRRLHRVPRPTRGSESSYSPPRGREHELGCALTAPRCPSVRSPARRLATVHVGFLDEPAGDYGRIMDDGPGRKAKLLWRGARAAESDSLLIRSRYSTAGKAIHPHCHGLDLQSRRSAYRQPVPLVFMDRIMDKRTSQILVSGTFRIPNLVK